MLSAEEQVKDLCQKHKTLNPIEILVQLMSGQDPRRPSKVYEFILELEERQGIEPPDEFDWLFLIGLIKSDMQYSTVDIGTVKDSAKQLMEYTYNKKKAIELTTLSEPIVEDTPLTRPEIKMVRKMFKLDY